MNWLSILELKSSMIIYSAVWYKHNMKVINLNWNLFSFPKKDEMMIIWFSQPQTIIQLYGRRWQIESYFKASKQYLAMDESQIQSYDGQVSYIAITELAYILLAWQERLNTDDRTLGDLFYSFTNSLPDITFICALVYLISVLKCSGNEFIEDKIDQFMHTIPSNVQNIISRVL